MVLMRFDAWLQKRFQIVLIYKALNKKSFKVGEIQWFLRFHGPPTPAGQGPLPWFRSGMDP